MWKHFPSLWPRSLSIDPSRAPPWIGIKRVSWPPSVSLRPWFIKSRTFEYFFDGIERLPSLRMILWQEGVFLGSALSSLSPPLHFPREQDGRDPSRLHNFCSFARFKIQWSGEDGEMWIFYVQVRQVVTTAMVVSATRGQIHLFTKDPKDKIHDTWNYT